VAVAVAPGSGSPVDEFTEQAAVASNMSSTITENNFFISH
jgi:hypothetical protein